MEHNKSSKAWRMLDPEQRQTVHWLVARINQSRVPDARQRNLQNASGMDLRRDSRLRTLAAGTASTVVPDTAAPCSATTTKRIAPFTNTLVVDDMPRATRLDNLYFKMRTDPEFKHLADVSNFVPGDGKWPGPDAMLIGEAPGANEDRLMRPFCGKSGNFLDGMLWDAGLRRGECFTTNVIKWRPPRNRTPTIEEIENAIPLLRKEVVTVLPAGGLIILLGSVPLNVADPNLKISQVHGQPFIRGKWTFMPMYHPAYVMRHGDSSKQRDEYRAEWRKIKEMRVA